MDMVSEIGMAHALVAGCSPPNLNMVPIGMVSPGWPVGACANGVVSYCAAMHSAFIALGVRSTIIAACLGGKQDENVVYAGRRWTLLRRAVARVSRAAGITPRRLEDDIASAAARLARDHRCGLLEMEEAFGLTRRVQERSGLPVVVRLHGPWFVVGPALGVPEDAAFRQRVSNEGTAIAQAPGVTAPSEDVLERTRRYYGLRLNDAEVIPNPAPITAEGGRWRADASETGRILFVGRFDRCKGADVLLEAFAEVVRREPAARLTFVGPDRGMTDGAGKSWSMAEYIVQRLGGVGNRIEWWGQMPATEVWQLRRRAAVTVICSRYENFPMAALEALSMGCPLVATAVGGLQEIVQNGHNGLLCRSDDPRDLAEKILTLLADCPLAQRIGQQAAVDCQRRYHPRVVARQTLAYYGRVLQRVRSEGACA